MAKTIRQSVTVKASPKVVYAALMDSKTHSRFTEAKAVVSRRVGGSFTAYDGYASGKNLELVPGKRIVQTWRANDWPKGVYSRLTVRLQKTGSSTRLTFTQSRIPARHYATIKRGWIEYYWKPMKEMLER